ncbi:MAG: methylated-DNA--[protein]-cysteine S-methyltransferase [Oscillospiraceae bacterium]|nr:methylated-DNA--[protein]-cysteine S-methyltransferase [Oscillospiraceae bacterium]
MNEKENCPCKHINCERHGRCSECMKHHTEDKKTPPACERIRIKQERKERHKGKVRPEIVYTIHFDSPVGVLCARADDNSLVKLFIDNEKKCPDTEESELLARVRTQVCEYFEGKRKVFDIPLNLYGTDFQMTVWNALLKIGYAATCCYSDIASMCGDRAATRAVGGAVNKNPVMIIVPCHRVIGKNGKLTGFAAGLDVKETLLRLENIL